MASMRFWTSERVWLDCLILILLTVFKAREIYHRGQGYVNANFFLVLYTRVCDDLTR